jgi:hypothetical protein
MPIEKYAARRGILVEVEIIPLQTEQTSPGLSIVVRTSLDQVRIVQTGTVTTSKDQSKQRQPG